MADTYKSIPVVQMKEGGGNDHLRHIMRPKRQMTVADLNNNRNKYTNFCHYRREKIKQEIALPPINPGLTSHTVDKPHRNHKSPPTIEPVTSSQGELTLEPLITKSTPRTSADTNEKKKVLPPPPVQNSLLSTIVYSNKTVELPSATLDGSTFIKGLAVINNKQSVDKQPETVKKEKVVEVVQKPPRHEIPESEDDLESLKKHEQPIVPYKVSRKSQGYKYFGSGSKSSAPRLLPRNHTLNRTSTYIHGIDVMTPEYK